MGGSEPSVSHALSGGRRFGPALNDLDTSKRVQRLKVGFPDPVLERSIRNHGHSGSEEQVERVEEHRQGPLSQGVARLGVERSGAGPL
jgi:hypothetical protein